MKTITVYRIQVNRFGEWINVGKPYRSKETAKDWRPFVKKYWHGMPTRVKAVQMEVKETP